MKHQQFKPGQRVRHTSDGMTGLVRASAGPVVFVVWDTGDSSSARTDQLELVEPVSDEFGQVGIFFVSRA
ncbi:hypothetical protein SEA_SQUEE_91 [Mycobacterium phage Squee]|nr:hypothetical protein SEA_FENN_96 [Mycobacterium phage Fenn]QBI99362.1 hypothetical protein SEA_NAIRA_95 [Mycobacterium phage Naira]